jgi:hypothetical protein
LNRWSGASVMANLRLGPIATSSGLDGRAPHPEDAAHARGERAQAEGRHRRRLQHLVRAVDQGLDRVRDLPKDGLSHEIYPSRLRLRVPRRRHRRFGGRWIDVVEHRRELHPGDPVDHRVVHFEQGRHVTLLQPFDHVELPERLRPVQGPRQHALHGVRQSRRPPGAGSAERPTWNSRSKRGSSTHTGSPRWPGDHHDLSAEPGREMDT